MRRAALVATMLVTAALSGCGRGVVELNERSFATMRDRTPLLLVDAYADWCGACRQLAPQVDLAAERLAGRAVVARLNVDRARATAQQYQIHLLPTLLLFRDGKLVGSSVGVTSADELVRWVEHHTTK